MEDALILCEGLFSTSDAKTAHGLVRYSSRCRIVGIIDSSLKGKDAGEILDGIHRGIKIYSSLQEALSNNPTVKYLIIGVATVGGKLPENYKPIIKEAIRNKLNIVSGLHEFISDIKELSELAEKYRVNIIDVRKIFQKMKIPYTGKINKVRSLKLVVVGTDACIGKRTVALMINNELNKRGIKSVFIGTGQTAWMQGARYGIVLDAMINDFIPGGLEHEIYRAYVEEKPEIIVVPGQGSLLHPVFPGSFEILSLLHPQIIVLQHAPGRKHLEDFPEYPMPSLDRYLKILELITERKVFAITINTENLDVKQIDEIVKEYEKKYNVVSCAPLIHGVGKIVNKIIESYF